MKEQNYLDHLVGVFGQPVAENPGVVIQDAAFRALGLERWRYLTLDGIRTSWAMPSAG